LGLCQNPYKKKATAQEGRRDWSEYGANREPMIANPVNAGNGRVDCQFYSSELDGMAHSVGIGFGLQLIGYSALVFSLIALGSSENSYNC
jgi:hypothetical protein